MLNADLHCHSTVSDGVLPPAEVAARAKANGVEIWALTDHDEIGGIREARMAAMDLGLAFVPGVEISVTWAGETVHIVGLQIDESNETLVQGLAATRSGRERRAHEIAGQLAAA
ncbi:MAG TPA: PHP domain-containing protein, partial [Burkholderiaceae bacterium]|nr:PHP domain-containing protein [Burkholderiaceae bacterium]